MTSRLVYLMGMKRRLPAKGGCPDNMSWRIQEEIEWQARRELQLPKKKKQSLMPNEAYDIAWRAKHEAFELLFDIARHLLGVKKRDCPDLDLFDQMDPHDNPEPPIAALYVLLGDAGLRRLVDIAIEHVRAGRDHKLPDTLFPVVVPQKAKPA